MDRRQNGMAAFNDLPENLRQAIFLEAFWLMDAQECKTLRMVCREARAAVDRDVTTLRFPGAALPATESNLLPRRQPTLAAVDLAAVDFHALAARFSALRTLDWRGACGRGFDKGDAWVAALAQARWPCLEVLDLRGSRLSGGALCTLAAASANFPALDTLDFSNNKLEASSFDDMPLDGFPALRRLNLRQCKLPLTVVCMLAAAYWPRLEDLNLRDTCLGVASTMALISGGVEAFPALRNLDLSCSYGMNPRDTGVLLPLACAAWPHLEVLNLQGYEPAKLDGQWGTMGAAPTRPPALRVLNLSNGRDEVILALARQSWPCLEDIDCGGNAMSVHEASALAEAAATRLPAVRRLRLGRARLWPPAMSLRALLSGSWLSLENLDLSSVSVGPEGAAALAAAATEGRLPAVRTLTLCSAALNDAGVEALMQAAWPQLEELMLDSNALRHTAAAALAAAAAKGHLPALRTLSIAHNKWRCEGVEELLCQQPWAKLEVLRLKRNKIDDLGPEHLANAVAAGQLPVLRTLELTGNDLGSLGCPGVAGLLRAPWPTLRELSLRQCKLKSRAGVTLAAAQRDNKLPALRILELQANDFGNEGTAALLQATWGTLEVLRVSTVGEGGALLLAVNGRTALPVLQTLHLGQPGLGVEGAEVMQAMWPEVEVVEHEAVVARNSWLEDDEAED